MKYHIQGLDAARNLSHVWGEIEDTPRPTWQARAYRVAKTSDLREKRIRMVFCSLISAHVPSSLVRMGVSRLKAGSFLKMPSLHLL